MNKMSINNIGRKWVIGRSLLTIEKRKKEDINKYYIFNIIKNYK
jgi:hypothetical protein